MITALIRNVRARLTKIRSGKILNRIGAGKRVFFENSQEGIAFKYIPGEIGRLSKYFVKQYGHNEYEIDSDSTSILNAVMKGKPISRKRYDNYCINKGVSWGNRLLTTEPASEAVGF